MALYTIGDLHLSNEVDKSMEVFGGAWLNYQEKLEQNLTALSPEDTLVIVGDLSWGINLTEALGDFRFLSRVPGQKILVKGNHDLWWDTVTKMNRFLDSHNITGIQFLHNNYHRFENAQGVTALCGTRGWFYEEDKGGAHDEKMRNREVIRLRTSLQAAKSAGVDRIYCFMHYPPLYGAYRCQPILDLMAEFGVERCYYGHLHGEACKFAFQGVKNGIIYRLVSGDSVNFQPILIWH